MSQSFKNDFLDNKAPMQLLPFDVLQAISRVYQFGALKYGPNTWRSLPDGSSRYLGALLRHLTAMQSGHEFDSESSLPHVYHLAWNALALVAFYLDSHSSAPL